jgi:hypothetical protein
MRHTFPFHSFSALITCFFFLAGHTSFLFFCRILSLAYALSSQSQLPFFHAVSYFCYFRLILFHLISAFIPGPYPSPCTTITTTTTTTTTTHHRHHPIVNLRYYVIVLKTTDKQTRTAFDLKKNLLFVLHDVHGNPLHIQYP